MSTKTTLEQTMPPTIQLVAADETKITAMQTRIPVMLPDMFVSFLAEKPRINPHYQHVRKQSEAWINDKCDFDARMRRRISACDFSFFCSISAPEANAERLRTMCDWGNWVFPWDDMFDNGHLRTSPALARQMMDSLLSVMRNETSMFPDDQLIDVHDSVWHRIAKSSSIGVQRRFLKHMTSYCNGAIKHVDQASHARLPSLEEQLATRRESAGVTPLFALVEYAHELELPDEVFEHRSVKEIERLGTDMVVLQNDMLSYCKEEAEGVDHNMVAVCRTNGMTAQQAFDSVNDLLRRCYRDWYLALAGLPQWGEKTDMQVQKYVQGVQDVVRANLNWSFKSQRYLGKAHDIVRQTREISVLPRPATLVPEANVQLASVQNTSTLSGYCLAMLLIIGALFVFDHPWWTVGLTKRALMMGEILS